MKPHRGKRVDPQQFGPGNSARRPRRRVRHSRGIPSLPRRAFARRSPGALSPGGEPRPAPAGGQKPGWEGDSSPGLAPKLESYSPPRSTRRGAEDAAARLGTRMPLARPDLRRHCSSVRGNRGAGAPRPGCQAVRRVSGESVGAPPDPS